MHSASNSRAEGRRGLLFILLAGVMWGTVGIATKALYGMSDTTPLSIGFFRLAIATPILLLTSFAMLGRRAFHIAPRDLIPMLLIGLATAAYQVCYFAAIERVGAAIAVLITLCTAPVMVAILSALFLRERLTLTVLLALVCALGGTMLLVRTDPGTTGNQTLIGILLALGSAFGYTMTVLFSRNLAGRYHPLQPLTIGFGAGALMLLPFALATGLSTTYPLAGWALLVHLGLVPTALAYVLFLVGMRSVTATVASVVTLVEPLTTTLLAWLLFGERLGPLGALGAALLLGAIGLLYRGESRRARIMTTQVSSGEV